MEQLELVRQWLLQFPLWGKQPLTVDCTGPKPGSCGLFPLGLEQLRCQEDVLGTVKYRYRRQFLLRRAACRSEDGAAWIMALEDWISRNPGPGLGADCTVRAEKGRLAKADGQIATYEAKLIIEYTEER